MARKNYNDYKPPFFMLRYIEQLGETTTQSVVSESLEIPGNHVPNGSMEVGITNIPNKITEIVSDNINNNLNLASTQNWDIQAYKNIGGEGKAAIGWAVVRPNPAITNANSLLPDGDTRPHILVKKEVAGARKGAISGETTNDDGVEYVYPTSGPNTTPLDTSTNYKGGKVEKYYTGATTTYVNDSLTYYPPFSKRNPPSKDLYQIVILDEGAKDIPSGYVVVKYYYEDKSEIDENKINIVSIATSGDDNNFVPTIDNTSVKDSALISDLKITKLNTNKVTKQKIFTLDLYEVAVGSSQKPNRFGFGIERFDFSGDSRKSVQQTRGKINIENIDSVQDNFYVDTWWKGPETIVLAGVIELPAAYDRIVSSVSKNPQNEPTIRISNDDKKSFIDIMESFFTWNNNPMRLNRGDKLQLVDYYRDPSNDPIKIRQSDPNSSQVYDVTFKNRKYTQSVEKPGIIMFEFNFLVLGRATL